VQKTIKRTIKRLFPYVVPFVRDTRGFIRANLCRINIYRKPKFTCPICNYSGPFVDYCNNNQIISHTKCPRCELYERHRLQHLVIKQIGKKRDLSKMAILHFAPELAFERLFNKLFAKHYTADIIGEGVDYQVDICSMPFENESFDVIFASHVLEHVIDDDTALSEVMRVLKPNGIAILPVPVVSPVTIEYNSPNQYEFGHVRAIGIDYFEKYKKLFSKVEIWNSADFEEKYQLYTYEMRNLYPTITSPLRQPMDGVKHLDYVPVCFK